MRSACGGSNTDKWDVVDGRLLIPDTTDTRRNQNHHHHHHHHGIASSNDSSVYLEFRWSGSCSGWLRASSKRVSIITVADIYLLTWN